MNKGHVVSSILPYALVVTIKSKGHSRNLAALIPFYRFHVLKTQQPLENHGEVPSSQTKPLVTSPRCLLCLPGDVLLHSIPSSLTPLTFTSAPILPTVSAEPSQQETISLHGLDRALDTCLMAFSRKPCIIAIYLSHLPGGQNTRVVPKTPTPWCTYPE